MNLNKWYISLVIILLLSTFILVNNGSKNTLFTDQIEKDEVLLADDPPTQPSLFNFNFTLPAIEIPIISGIFGLGETGIWFILFILFVIVLVFVTSIIISRQRKKKKEKKDQEKNDLQSGRKELKKRRETLGNQIEVIINFLKECLDGKFSQGITEGFERLDEALKEFSKISRPGWLTPREFSRLEIPYFDKNALKTAVEQFYRITYGQKLATRGDLENFITNFQQMIADQKILSWKADYPKEMEDSGL
ncbi:MAG: hypothetical protein ACXAC8_08280 [Candidatus Hodarchaeales archaeon]|jgi:preprotein translocase subunit SecG